MTKYYTEEEAKRILSGEQKLPDRRMKPASWTIEEDDDNTESPLIKMYFYTEETTGAKQYHHSLSRENCLVVIDYDKDNKIRGVEVIMSK